MYLQTRKNRLNFGSRSHLDADLGFLKGFFNIAKYGIFPQFGWGKMIRYSRKSYHRYIFRPKIPQ